MPWRTAALASRVQALAKNGQRVAVTTGSTLDNEPAYERGSFVRLEMWRVSSALELSTGDSAWFKLHRASS